MDNYLNSFREMLSLRGLTDHTITSYSTYISAYLQYLSSIIHTSPEEASWQEMRDFISWIQMTRRLSDRTVNACISQLRFFTRYVLHKPWDPYQLPFRRFDSYVPFIPTRDEMQIFLSSISDLKFKALICLMFSSGLRIGEVRMLKCADIEHSRKRIHICSSKNRSVVSNLLPIFFKNLYFREFQIKRALTSLFWYNVLDQNSTNQRRQCS